MENIFKFKKAKKTVGDFDADDPYEWTLLIKQQIGDVTLFVHFHKLWLVEEKPEIEADEDNGIEYQAAVERQPVCNVYTGFIKDSKFVVERQYNFKERIDELAQKRFLKNLQNHLDDGFKKDLYNYGKDGPITPDYYGHNNQPGVSASSKGGGMTIGKTLPHQMLKMASQIIGNPKQP